MRKVLAVVGSAVVGVSVVLGGSAFLSSQSGTALTGTVTSQQEGEMEGVLVTARRSDANFDVTVVSNAQGVYSFPQTHIAPGTYAVKIRAVGYDLVDPGPATVSDSGAATLDLTLEPTSDLSSQITSVEWITSVAGTDEQKALVVKQIASCTYCHSLERIIKSRHNAEQMVNVIHRMQKYYPDGTMAGTEGRGRRQLDSKEAQDRVEQNPTWGFMPGANKVELAAYLATINRSDGRSLPTDLKTLPRPTGKGTQVIITQYDQPRRDTVAHDMDVDSKGRPWYTDQSRPYVGMLDPETRTFKEWDLPPVTHHEFAGGSDIQVDLDDNLWFPATTDNAQNHFGLPVKFDPKTETFTQVEMPEGAVTQFMARGPDGKIWSGFGTFYRIDPKTAMVDYSFDWTKAPNLPPGPHSGYEIAVSPEGNPYITDFGGAYIVGVDVSTNTAKFYKVPTPDSQPRRGMIDEQGRYWFGEYTGDKIGMFNTRTEEFTEYPLRKWSAPYTSSLPDREGQVYVPSNTSDRVFRLDTNSGEIVEYLMPTRDFDAKQVVVDPISERAVWLANVRNARLIKIEPLD